MFLAKPSFKIKNKGDKVKKLNIRELTTYSMVAAIYVLLTWAFGFMAFGGIQFRIAEALVLLCFFNKKYFFPLVVGCLVANLMSSLGALDMLFGTTATILALIGIMYSKNLIIASIWPVLINGVLISIEICWVSKLWNWPAFLLNFATVALGELVCVSILGVILFSILRKNDGFMRIICANQNYDDIET